MRDIPVYTLGQVASLLLLGHGASVVVARKHEGFWFRVEQDGPGMRGDVVGSAVYPVHHVGEAGEDFAARVEAVKCWEVGGVAHLVTNEHKVQYERLNMLLRLMERRPPFFVLTPRYYSYAPRLHVIAPRIATWEAMLVEVTGIWWYPSLQRVPHEKRVKMRLGAEYVAPAPLHDVPVWYLEFALAGGDE